MRLLVQELTARSGKDRKRWSAFFTRTSIWSLYTKTASSKCSSCATWRFIPPILCCHSRMRRDAFLQKLRARVTRRCWSFKAKRIKFKRTFSTSTTTYGRNTSVLIRTNMRFRRHTAAIWSLSRSKTGESNCWSWAGCRIARSLLRWSLG